MLLMYYLNENGDRVYTLEKFDPKGNPTLSAHPARFSPADPYSKQRIMIKKGLIYCQHKRSRLHVKVFLRYQVCCCNCSIIHCLS